MEIIVDSREPDWIFDYLVGAYPQFAFKLRKLDEGDFMSGTCIFERKEISDLISSIITDNRHHNQKQRLYSMSTDYHVGYLVHGNLTEAINNLKEHADFELDSNIIYGAISSMIVRENFTIIWVEDIVDALNIMIKTMQKMDEGHYQNVKIKDKKILLSKVFGINYKQMGKLLDRHGTLRAISDATQEELMRTNGIGQKRAKNIIQTFYDEI